jgi:hypothetical protein
MSYSAKNVLPTQLSPHGLARALGWFSIGLGLAQVFAPKVFTRTLGMEGREGFLRACGTREIASGIGLLADPQRRAAWMWARASGDAVDIAALALRYRADNPQKSNVAVALGLVAGIAALDVACAWALARKPLTAPVTKDYSARSGFPRSPEEMRGIARQPLPQRSFGDGRNLGSPQPPV